MYFCYYFYFSCFRKETLAKPIINVIHVKTFQSVRTHPLHKFSYTHNLSLSNFHTHTRITIFTYRTTTNTNCLHAAILLALTLSLIPKTTYSNTIFNNVKRTIHTYSNILLKAYNSLNQSDKNRLFSYDFLRFKTNCHG